MKKILFAISAVALLFATSCKKESINPAVDVPEGSFIATIDNGANPQNAPVVKDGMGTMTTIGDQNYVFWESGDEISINGSIYTTDASGSSVIFSGEGASGLKYHAFYPATIAGEGAAGTLPATQTYVEGKVSNLPMYACSENNQLTFHNICAALKIVIPSFMNGATSIEVSSGQRMNGAFTVTDNTAVMTTDQPAAANKKVTIAKSEGTFATGEVVYIAVPAQAYTNFRIEAFDGTTLMWTKTIATCTLAVNTVSKVNLMPISDALCFTATEEGGATVRFHISSAVTTPIQYWDKNCTDWRNYTSDSVITLAKGGKVYFRASQSHLAAFGASDEASSSRFFFSDSVAASGNIMSLYGANDISGDYGVDAYAFAYLFKGCSTLLTAPQLSTATIQEGSYKSMFQDCSGLKQAPALETETMRTSCYQSMFQGCSNLMAAPDLPSTSLATSCYQSMFEGCSSLTEAPDLNAANLANNCYSSMFKGCSLLVKAPVLNAQTLVSGCYTNMFQDCCALHIVIMTASGGLTTTLNPLNGWLSGAGTTGGQQNNMYINSTVWDNRNGNMQQKKPYQYISGKAYGWNINSAGGEPN